MPNVVHTPHLAGRTLWASRRVFDAVVDDYERHLAGDPLEWATPASRIRAADAIVHRR
jgi:phosphoglycerate dehydrogenase-like enzyme